MAKKKTATTSVDAVRHKDQRKNIPTEELRDFVADDEQNPQAVLYPRNPDLDPQLVWKGKDEQDSQPLEVPSVPVYIQEKAHPQAIIEDFRRSLPSPSRRRAGGEGDGESQLNLFSDFNGLPEEFDQRVDFYHHEGNWSNRLILGNSLLVMTSLASTRLMAGRFPYYYLADDYPQIAQMSADAEIREYLRKSAKSADKLIVELNGLDIYDPTTSEIRSSSTDDIACWFIDTNYNGESFFVRHAYFTGADEPYNKLKRALKKGKTGGCQEDHQHDLPSRFSGLRD